MHLPPIGKRILKSAAAVFFCLLLDQLRQGAGIVFYSCIAAVLCMQQDVSSSVRIGRNRVIGTLIGGVFGMLVLVGERWSSLDHWLLHALIVSAVIIGIIYLTVLLHQTSASYISCVVFLSVVISHGHDADPFLFAMNRVLDTLIGIAVAYAVNAVHIPWRRGEGRACLCDLSAIDGRSAAFRVQLRRLQERGVCLYLHALLPPGANADLLSDVHPQGIALFGGSLLYDPQSGHYQPLCSLSAQTGRTVMDLLRESGCTSFAYVPCRDILQIHISEEAMDPCSEQLFQLLRRAPAHACIFSPPAPTQAISAISTVIASEKLPSFEAQMKAIGDIRLYVWPLMPTHALVVLCPAQASLHQAIDQWQMDGVHLQVITALMDEEALFARCDTLCISERASREVREAAERCGGVGIQDPIRAIRRCLRVR